MVQIRKAAATESATVAKLAQLLWPDHEAAELEAEFLPMLQDPGTAIFLAFQEDAPIGFAHCQLRHDYVEGTDSTPVGYLEGIFVAEGYRKSGIARAMLSTCEGWARNQGCAEFASDCELTNTDSLLFHLNAGFEEANRIICFTKKL